MYVIFFVPIIIDMQHAQLPFNLSEIYRHFINKVTDPVFANYKSTILTRLAADDSLHYFQTIKDCDLYWPDTSVKSQQRPRKVIAVGEADPPPKRPNLTVTP